MKRNISEVENNSVSEKSKTTKKNFLSSDTIDSFNSNFVTPIKESNKIKYYAIPKLLREGQTISRKQIKRWAPKATIKNAENLYGGRQAGRKALANQSRDLHHMGSLLKQEATIWDNVETRLNVFFQGLKWYENTIGSGLNSIVDHITEGPFRVGELVLMPAMAASAVASIAGAPITASGLFLAYIVSLPISKNLTESLWNPTEECWKPQLREFLNSFFVQTPTPVDETQLPTLSTVNDDVKAVHDAAVGQSENTEKSAAPINTATLLLPQNSPKIDIDLIKKVLLRIAVDRKSQNPVHQENVCPENRRPTLAVFNDFHEKMQEKIVLDHLLSDPRRSYHHLMPNEPQWSIAPVIRPDGKPDFVVRSQSITGEMNVDIQVSASVVIGIIRLAQDFAAWYELNPEQKEMKRFFDAIDRGFKNPRQMERFIDTVLNSQKLNSDKKDMILKLGINNPEYVPEARSAFLSKHPDEDLKKDLKKGLNAYNEQSTLQAKQTGYFPDEKKSEHQAIKQAINSNNIQPMLQQFIKLQPFDSQNKAEIVEGRSKSAIQEHYRIQDFKKIANIFDQRKYYQETVKSKRKKDSIAKELDALYEKHKDTHPEMAGKYIPVLEKRTDTQSLYKLRDLYEQCGERIKFKNLTHELAKKFPNDQLVVEQSAYMYARDKDFVSAVGELKKLSNQSEFSVETKALLHNEIYHQLQVKNYPEASKLCKLFVAIASSAEEAYFYSLKDASISLEQGLEADAIKSLGELALKHQADATKISQLDELLFFAHRKQEEKTKISDDVAINNILERINLCSLENPDTILNILNYYSSKGSFQKAVDHYRKYSQEIQNYQRTPEDKVEDGSAYFKQCFAKELDQASKNNDFKKVAEIQKVLGEGNDLSEIRNLCKRINNDGLGCVGKGIEIIATKLKELIVPLIPMGKLRQASTWVCNRCISGGKLIYGGTQYQSILLDLESGLSFGTISSVLQVTLIFDEVVLGEMFGTGFNLSGNELISKAAFVLYQGTNLIQAGKDVSNIVNVISSLDVINVSTISDAIYSNFTLTGGATFVRLGAWTASAGITYLYGDDEYIIKQGKEQAEDDWITLSACVDGTGKLAGQAQEAAIVAKGAAYVSAAGVPWISTVVVTISGGIASIISAPVVIGSGVALLASDVGWSQSDRNMHNILLNGYMAINRGDQTRARAAWDKYQQRQNGRVYKYERDNELSYLINPIRTSPGDSPEDLEKWEKDLKKYKADNPSAQLVNQDLTICYYQRGKTEEALSEAKKMLEKEQTNVFALWIKGTILTQKSDLNEINEGRKILLAINADAPYFQQAQQALANSYIQEQNQLHQHKNQEITNIQKNVMAQPTQEKQLILIAQEIEAYKQYLGKVTELEKAYKKHAQLAGNKEVENNQATDTYDANKVDENPQIQYLKYLAITVELSQPSENTPWENLEKRIDQLIKLKPQADLKTALEHYLLICYMQQNKFKEVRPMISGIPIDNIEDQKKIELLVMQAMAEFHSEDSDGAIVTLNKALVNDVNNIRIHTFISRIYEFKLNKLHVDHQKYESEKIEALKTSEKKVQEQLKLLMEAESEIALAIKTSEEYLAYQENYLKEKQALEEKIKIHFAYLAQPETKVDELPNSSKKDDNTPAVTPEKILLRYTLILEQALPINYFICRAHTAQFGLDIFYWLNKLWVQNKQLDNNLKSWRHNADLALGFAELTLKVVERNLVLLVNTQASSAQAFSLYILDVIKSVLSVAKNFRQLCGKSEIGDYRLERYVSPCIEMLIAIGSILLDLKNNLTFERLMDARVHEQLLKIPEIHHYFLEPNPNEWGAYCRLFLGKFLENLGNRRGMALFSSREKIMSDLLNSMKDTVSYFKTMEDMLYSWEAYLKKYYINISIYSTMVCAVIPYNLFYINLLLFQRAAQIFLAAGDTVFNINLDRINCTKKYELKVAAVSGNPQANFYLGMLYVHEKNVESAKFYFQEAIAYGHPEAQNKLDELSAKEKSPATKDAKDKVALEVKKKNDTAEEGRWGHTIIYMAGMGLFALQPTIGLALFFTSTVSYLGYAEQFKLNESGGALRKVGFFQKIDFFAVNNVNLKGITNR